MGQGNFQELEKQWLDYPKNTTAYTASLANNATTTKMIPTGIVSNKEVLSDSNINPADDVEIGNGKFQSSTVNVPITTTALALEIHADMLSKEAVISNILAICKIVLDKAVISNEIRTERVSNKDANSNLNTTDDYNADAAAADDDIDNSKLPLKWENLIGDLDDIRDEYYQVKRKSGLIYDRHDAVNPPPLPPESPAYAINIPCIHSNKPNNGEILSLLLISPVY